VAKIFLFFSKYHVDQNVMQILVEFFRNLLIVISSNFEKFVPSVPPGLILYIKLFKVRDVVGVWFRGFLGAPMA